ncbi:MAG: hypothetical protein P1U32_08860, partial [Legionellaceae bacterium]|nr:hypothetical protein [Legionellaceae bacterium]
MNVRRVIRLIKNDALMLEDTILYSYIVFVILSTLLMDGYPGINWYQALLYAGGFILTQRAFSSLHHMHKGYRYLTLPASNFEKLFARWLLTGILYALVFTILVYALFPLGELIKSSIPAISSKPLLVEQGFWEKVLVVLPNVRHVIMHYLVLHSVVFLGCIYFKKHALFKTGLTLMTLISCMMLLFGLVVYFLCPGCMVLSFFHLFEAIFLGGYY